MLTLGGALKRREKISGRLADALAWLYIGSAVLKRFCDEKQPADDLPFARWGVEHTLYEVERALDGVLDNLPNRAMATVLRLIVFPFGARRRPPSDALGAQVARALLEGDARERLTRDIYVPKPDEPGIGLLETAWHRVVHAAPIVTKLRHLVRQGKLESAPLHWLAETARQAELLSEEEYSRVTDAEAARRAAIEVDAFESSEMGAPERRSVSGLTTRRDLRGVWGARTGERV